MAVNKQIQFVKGSAILILSNLVLKGINFLLLPLYTKYLSPSELGISDIITNMTAIIFPVLVMGLDSAFSAFYFDEKDKNYKSKVFKTIWTTLIIASVIPFVIAISSDYIAYFVFGSHKYSILVGISLVSVSMNLWYLPFALYVRMENKMTLFAVINVIASFTMICFNIVFVSILEWGVYSLIISTAIIQFLQFLLYLKFSGIRIKDGKFDISLLRRMFRYSLPLIPAVLASWVLNLSDRYILLYFSNEAEVGLYGIATRFGTVVMLFANGIYTAYTTYAYEKKNDSDAKLQYSRILNSFSIGLMIICFIVSIFGKEIIHVMADVEYKRSYLLLTPILYSQLLYGINTIIGYAMGFEKKSYYNLIAVCVGAIINLILNFIFIPYYGAIAASYSTLISFAFMMGIIYLFAQKLYYVNYDMKKLFLTILLTCILSIIAQRFCWEYKIIITIFILGYCCLLYKNVFYDYVKLLRVIFHRG